MDENLTSTYSYQGIAPKIPWNRPLSKFKVKFRSDWGHPKVILSKLKTFVMRKILQFGLTIKRDLETVFIWRYLVIYQQYYLPLPPYIFSQNQAMVFIIPDSPVRGSFIIDEGTGPWFLVKTQNKPIYSITNISMANMAEDNFPIPSSFRFSSSYSFILSTFWKFIQSRDPQTISCISSWSTPDWTIRWSLVKSSLSRPARMSYIHGGHWMHSHGFLIQFYGSFQIILQAWTQLDNNDMDVNRSILCNFTPSKTRQSARLWNFTKISTWLWIMDFMSCYKSFLFLCPFVPE